jgi:hypothetical protein
VGGRGAPNEKYLRSIFTPPLSAKLSACRVYKTYWMRLVSFFYKPTLFFMTSKIRIISHLCAASSFLKK